MWKMTAGEFDISCIPCKHWWVRYAEFCQVLNNAKYIITHKINWNSKEYSEIYKVLKSCSCQFIKNQKECQNYEPCEWYKNKGKWMSIKEIKKQKGYEV